MRVRTNVKAGGISGNHNQSLLQVKTGVKAGGSMNHNQSLLRVKTGVKAGGSLNHNQTCCVPVRFLNCRALHFGGLSPQAGFFDPAFLFTVPQTRFRELLQ